MSARHFVAGVCLGAGLAHFLDPAQGPRRRRRLADRVQALAAEVGAGGRHGRHDDLPGLGGAFERGTVLRGGGASPIAPAAALLGVAGGALTAYGVHRGGIVGRSLRALGAGLMATGLHGIRRPAAPTATERRRALDLQQTLEVAAPPDEVFAFWRDLRNVARAFAHVREVRELGDGRVVWRVSAPAGAPVEWVAEVVELVPGRVLVWRSEPGSPIDQTGMVRVEPTGTGTRLGLRLCYRPPSARAGAVIAQLLGPDPKQGIDADLRRLRLLLETGSPTEERQGDVV